MIPVGDFLGINMPNTAKKSHECPYVMLEELVLTISTNSLVKPLTRVIFLMYSQILKKALLQSQMKSCVSFITSSKNG